MSANSCQYNNTTLLFLVYINDLPSRLSSTVWIFADDCLLYCKILSINDTKALQQDLEKQQAWKRDWLMEFNPSKCEAITFTKKTKPVEMKYKLHDMGLIGRNIRYKQTDVMLKLFKCLVRPHVEYCTVAWSPHYKKDKHLIEKVQRQFIKMLPEFKQFTMRKYCRS